MTNKFIPGQTYKDREGREYMFVGYAPNAAPLGQAVFTLESTIVTRAVDGKSRLRTHDIVQTKDVWVNVYYHPATTTGVTCSVSTYPSKDEAREQGRDRSGYLFSQKITVTV